MLVITRFHGSLKLQVYDTQPIARSRYLHIRYTLLVFRPFILYNPSKIAGTPSECRKRLFCVALGGVVYA